MHPVRLNIHNPVTLLEKQNIRSDFRSGILLKCGIRQSDCSQKLRPLCQIFSDFRTFLIHRSLACDKGNHATGTDFIQCLCKEIIMDQEVILIILLICHLILSEWHITHCHIKKVIRIVCLFKS